MFYFLLFGGINYVRECTVTTYRKNLCGTGLHNLLKKLGCVFINFGCTDKIKNVI